MIENVVLIGVVLAVCVLTDVALLLLVKILPMYYPSDLKVSRWESGNLPIKHPKFTLPMQYFGFMFMFMAAEPIIVLLLLLSAYPSMEFIALMLMVLLLLLPAIYVGYKAAIEMADIGTKHQKKEGDRRWL